MGLRLLVSRLKSNASGDLPPGLSNISPDQIHYLGDSWDWDDLRRSVGACAGSGSALKAGGSNKSDIGMGPAAGIAGLSKVIWLSNTKYSLKTVYAAQPSPYLF